LANSALQEAFLPSISPSADEISRERPLLDRCHHLLVESGATVHRRFGSRRPTCHDPAVTSELPVLPAPRDTRNRPLHDLRISVTDRCNFRCVYCMPRAVFGPDHAFLPREEILSFEEIARLVGIFTRLGVEKVRLTGGEPLVRRELATLVGMLAGEPGVRDLTLTTNGVLLPQHAAALAAAGLHRVTISLDADDDETFGRMNDARAPVDKVLAGIDAAEAAGLGPIKVNMVVKRGWNEHAILSMARRFRGTGRILRFIEYMDVGHSNGWRLDEVVTADEILSAVGAEFPLEPMPPTHPGEVAERYRYADGSGEIGIIASVSRPFCGDCSRARLSADGQLYTCLFATRGHDLRALLRGGATDTQLEADLRAVWESRDDRYSELRTAETANLPKVEMSYIGG
jgi:cyclic pyranopterin phosphate synthase